MNDRQTKVGHIALVLLGMCAAGLLLTILAIEAAL